MDIHFHLFFVTLKMKRVYSFPALKSHTNIEEDNFISSFEMKELHLMFKITYAYAQDIYL